MIRLAVAIVLQRLLTAIPMVLLVSIVVFVILRAIPADPIAMLIPPGASAADVAALRAAFGLDLPIAQQYWVWLSHALQGDLGQSIIFRVPVTSLLAAAVPATAELCLVSLGLALVFSIPGGCWRIAGGPGSGRRSPISPWS